MQKEEKKKFQLRVRKLSNKVIVHGLAIRVLPFHFFTLSHDAEPSSEKSTPV